MSYLKEFQEQIANHDYPAYLRLWEEYCASDEIDSEELKRIFTDVKASEFADSFGRHVERILPLLQPLEGTPAGNELFRLLIDVQTSNTDQLYILTCAFLKNLYGQDPDFAEKFRLIGLRSKENFQGAISHFELLSHMKKGNFAFHTGGWGIGEIVDVSMIREQLSLEFDYVPGKKDLSFQTAFKTLIPIQKNHFLALRFGSPDELEKKAREEPVEVVRLLLRDLGAKTAGEIKDELCDLVIPAKDWTRWWQGARGKIKKDTMISSPEDTREPFFIRGAEVSHEERLHKALENKPDADTLIQMVYSYFKDFPETLKNEEFRTSLEGKLQELLSFEEITDAQELQVHFFLEDLSSKKESEKVVDLITSLKDIAAVILEIPIQSFKKRALIEVRKLRSDWQEIFLGLLYTVDQNLLRDYIFGELNQEATLPALKQKLEDLTVYPSRFPEALIWYFQKVTSQPKLPFADPQGKSRFFEAFLILLSHVEQNTGQRDLVKKIHTILSNGRYAVVRQIMQGVSIEEIKEFLLLSTKCHSFSDHDIKIFHSLAEVVFPSLAKAKKKRDGSDLESQPIWTSAEGFQKLQKRIQQVATVETVENAKEIEVARSHGDLRENAEFKAALERRDRLQSELKFLSEQMNRTRIITKDDIALDSVGIGVIVDCAGEKGEKISYTLLGPWDADTERHILSFQSKLAQTMQGLKVGNSFRFQEEEFTILAIRPALI